MTSNENFRTNVHNVLFLQLPNPSKGFQTQPLWLQGLPVLFMETCCTIGNQPDFTLKHYCELEYKQGSLGNFRSQRKSWEIWLQKWNRLKQFLLKEYETVKEIDSEEDN